MTSNEIRSIIGRKPSSDPKADKLVNSNLNQPEEGGKESSSGGSSIASMLNNSPATMDSKRIQNARTWLNQIGTQKASQVESDSETS